MHVSEVDASGEPQPASLLEPSSTADARPSLPVSDAFTVLCSLATRLVDAATTQQALRLFLNLLVEEGLIEAGAAEIEADPSSLVFAGPSSAFPTLNALRLQPGGRHCEAGTSPIAPAALTFPLRSAAGLIGCCYLLPLKEMDAAYVQALAAQVTLAVERALLQEHAHSLEIQEQQRIQEVSTIYEIGRAIDAVQLDRLLEIITEKAARVMKAQACSLMRLNPYSRQLTIAASFGLSDDVVDMTHQSVGEGIAGRVAQTGEPMLIVDPGTDPRLAGVPIQPEIGSSMVVPMRDEEGKVLGVLSIRRRRPAPDFDEDDLRLFSVFASQAALAVTNKQLYDDLNQHVKELSTLSDLTQAVISHLDLASLLETVADNIVEVVQFDRCCIFLVDRHTRDLRPYTLRGYPPDVIGRNPVKRSDSVVGLVARKQMPIVENDARNALQPMRGFARALGTDSFLAIPIISKGTAIGVVVADNKLSGRPIQPQAVELLTTFVSQAGIAVENAQLNEDRQQRYQEINRIATQTDNILRSIAMAVVVLDGAGHVARMNGPAEALWGVKERSAHRLDSTSVVTRLSLPPDQQAMFQAQLAGVRESGKPVQQYKVRLQPRGREIIANLFISPLIDRAGEQEGVILLIEDVTREIKMEAEIGRMRRLADIGQLAAKMAHEVRNPLSSIKGAAQLMRNEYEDLAPFREFLDIIIDEVNHLNRITTDLLDFARPLQLDLRRTSVNDLAERTLQFLSTYLAEHRVTARLVPGDSAEIFCDAKQIEQVMRNIVINAAQAMPDGGALTISVEARRASGPVAIHFCDTGPGIPPEKAETIFQPFYTTKTKGTGLGLPIVRRILENHGGAIAVEEAPEGGTMMTVTLPVRPAVPVAPHLPMPESERHFASDLPDL